MQLLKVVLGLLAIVTAYVVGKNVLDQPVSVSNEQDVVRAVVGVQSDNKSAHPIAPSAPRAIESGGPARQLSDNKSVEAGSDSELKRSGRILSVAGVTQVQSSDSRVSDDVLQPSRNDKYGAGAYERGPVRMGEGVFFVAPGGSDSNPGTESAPWATLNHAARVLTAGQIVYVRGGVYKLSAQVVPQNSGRSDAEIVFAGYPGETAVLDASGAGALRDKGAIFVDNNVEYIRIEGLIVRNSYGAGISMCNAAHVTVIGNTIQTTFSSGISANSPRDTGCQQKHADFTVMYNTIIDATTMKMRIAGYDNTEAPHEAISIMGVDGFEVAYNHVRDSEKEGIDVKETSSNGVVHHNLVEDIARQCYYVDAWHGLLSDIEFYANVGRRCGFMGFAISVENAGAVVRDISFHHNLLYDNGGSGIYFSRFSADGPRSSIAIYNNTIHNNGYGTINNIRDWAPGGIMLLSSHVENVKVYDNIISDNNVFQLGVHTSYNGAEGLSQRKIVFVDNVMNGKQENPSTSIYQGPVEVYSGLKTMYADPMYAQPSVGDFSLQISSPAQGKGAF